MLKALVALTRTPQNNLRIFQVVYYIIIIFLKIITLCVGWEFSVCRRVPNQPTARFAAVVPPGGHSGSHTVSLFA